MQWTEIENIVATAPHTAWFNGGRDQTRVYSPNVNLFLILGETEDELFSEWWTEKFANKKAAGAPLQLWFAHTCLFECRVVGVDGFRVYLPLPDPTDQRPKPFELRLAEIYAAGQPEGVDTFYRYTERAGFNLSPA